MSFRIAQSGPVRFLKSICCFEYLNRFVVQVGGHRGDLAGVSGSPP